MDSRSLVFYSLAVIQSYLLGAIPFGYLLAKYVKGVDVRKAGSGNIGATNVGRVAGAKLGILAFVLDVVKGFTAPTLIAFMFHVLVAGSYKVDAGTGTLEAVMFGGGFSGLRILCGMAAIAGHVWSVFLGFKGGKGVATSMGVLLGLSAWPTLTAFALWIAVTRVSGYVSLGSVAAAAAMPPLWLVYNRGSLGERWRLFAFVVAVAAIVLVRHRTNIRRLIAGTEHRFDFKSRKVV